MQHETELMTRYLLGELSEQEEEDIEKRYFSDREYFEQLLMVESTLLDEYASGDLDQRVRKLVESNLLGSAGQKRELNFSRELLSGISQAKPRLRSGMVKAHSAGSGWARLQLWFKNPVVRALLALCLLLVALSSSLLIWNRGLRRTVRQLEADRASLQEENVRSIEEAANDKARNQNSSERQDPQKQSVQDPDGLVASLLLTSDNVVRGGGQSSRVTRIGPGIRSLRIQVDIGQKSGSGTYQVRIKNVEGGTVWKDVVANSGNQGVRLRFTVPVGLVPPGDYILTVTESGIDLNDYSFSIRKSR